MRNRWPRFAVLAVAVAGSLTVCACRREAPAGHSRPNPFQVPKAADRRQPRPSYPSDPSCAIELREVGAKTGIDFQHTDGSSGRRYIVEAMSTGIATFDYDGDGLIDLYFPNGAPLPGCTPAERPRHALYKNLGNWRFRDVTDEAGTGCREFGMGAVAADYDNDGDQDLYVSNFGPNVLYRNNGDGTFTDVTDRAGVQRPTYVGAGVAFLDADLDGALDLYVGNYIELNLETHVPHTDRGHASYPSPREYTPVADNLFHNNGDGTFTDVSESSGVGRHAGRTMGLIAADYDADGDTDVFICNDVQENFLFQNDGSGRFEEGGVLAGVAMNPQGELIANMAVDCGDYDHDGLLDFYTSNYQNQLPMLLRNLGGGIFENVTSTSGAGDGCLPYVNWGCGFADFDNDGHRDVFIANGHTEDNVEERDLSTWYRCPNFVLWNTGRGRFVNISDQAGDGLQPVEASRGTAFEDFDNDGDIDVVVLNSRARPTVIRNMLHESGCPNHWIQLRLQGVHANRDGVGAHVTVVAGRRRQLQEVHAGRGYQSHWGSRLHFGLGRTDRIDRVEVRWPGGAREVFDRVGIDRLTTLVEGEGHKPE